MAKYNVMFSCGHEETIQLYGPGKERERKIDYYKNYGLCRNCYKAQRDAEFAKKSEEATEMFGTLPELGGRFGGEVLAGTALGETLVHLWMTVQIVFKACGYVLTLRNDMGS